MRQLACQACGRTIAWDGHEIAVAPTRCPGCQGSLVLRAPSPFIDSAREPFGTEHAARMIGPYQLVRELGRGSNGVVWLAEKPGLERQFALKVLHESELGDEESVARFKLEAAIASKLDETGVIGVYDIGRDGRSWYYAMEYCPGKTLEERISDGAIPPGEACEIIAALARTMEQAHAQGVIHRDLKPANVILDARTGRPRITDFGLAKAPSLLRDMTRSGDVLGTPYYMAPEQLHAESSIDHRIDIYALGVILYEALCGQRPYKAASFQELAARVKKHPPTPLRDRAPNVPEGLAAIVDQAMARRRGERYMRAGDLADDLERWLRGDVPRAISNPSTDARAARRPRLVVLLPLLAGAALLGGGAGAGVVMLRRKPPATDIPEPTTAGTQPATQPAGSEAPAGEARDLMAKAEALDHESVSAEKVLALARQALEAAGRDAALIAEVRARRAQLALRRCRPELALEEGRTLREAGGDAALEGQWIVAQALLALGRDDDAFAELDELARSDPLGPRGHTAAAIRHRLAFDVELAMARARAANASGPFVPALIEQAYLALVAGRGLGEVEEPLGAAAKLDPDHPRVLLLQATVRLVSGAPTASILAPLDRLLHRAEPEADPDALLLRARVRMRLEQFDGAAADVDRVLELRPEQAGARFLRGVFLWGRGRKGDATEEWARAWISDPAEVEGSLRTIDPRTAAEARERLGLDAAEQPPLPPRLRILPDLRRRLEARAAKAGPAAEPLLEGLLAAAEGRPWREVAPAFARADAADPSSPVVAIERARVLLGRNLFDLALGALRRARDLGVEASLCDRMEGDLWHRRGKRYKAAELWDRVTRRDPDSLEGLCATASAGYMRAPNMSDAKIGPLIERALAIDPDHVPTMLLASGLVDPRAAGAPRKIEDLERRIVEANGLIDAQVLELAHSALIYEALSKNGGKVEGRSLMLRFNERELTQLLQGLEQWATLSRGAAPLLRAMETALMGAQDSPREISRRFMFRARRLMREARVREPDRGEVWMWLGFLELGTGGEREDVLTNWRHAREVEPMIQVRPDWIDAYKERFGETESLKNLNLPVAPESPPLPPEPR